MDDVNKSGLQQPVSDGVDASGTETVEGVNPVSTLPSKEGQPKEVIKLSDAGPEINPELREIGVEGAPKEPTLEFRQQEQVVTPTQPIVAQVSPVSIPLASDLPMTETQAMQLKKNSKPTDTSFGRAWTTLREIFKIKNRKIQTQSA